MADRKQNTKFAKEFGRRLQARMEYLGLTQTELAKRSGLTQPEISHIVHGQIVPWADTVVKLARALNKSTDELINFEV